MFATLFHSFNIAHLGDNREDNLLLYQYLLTRHPNRILIVQRTQFCVTARSWIIAATGATSQTTSVNLPLGFTL